MQNEPSSEFDNHQQLPESLNNNELTFSLGETGFKESSEMISIRYELIEALLVGNIERISELSGSYRELGEPIADE